MLILKYSGFCLNSVLSVVLANASTVVPCPIALFFSLTSNLYYFGCLAREIFILITQRQDDCGRTKDKIQNKFKMQNKFKGESKLRR